MTCSVERNPDITIDNEAGAEAGKVQDLKAQDFQNQMLIELRIMNLHLAVITNENFTEQDIEE